MGDNRCMPVGDGLSDGVGQLWLLEPCRDVGMAGWLSDDITKDPPREQGESTVVLTTSASTYMSLSLA